MSTYRSGTRKDLEDYSLQWDRFQFPAVDPTRHQECLDNQEEFDYDVTDNRTRKVNTRRDAFQYNHGRSPIVAAKVKSLQQDTERASNLQTQRVGLDVREEAKGANEADVADSVETADGEPLEWVR